jgi:hypothetical protein
MDGRTIFVNRVFRHLGTSRLSLLQDLRLEAPVGMTQPIGVKPKANTKLSPFEENTKGMSSLVALVERLPGSRPVFCSSNTGLTAAFQDDRALRRSIQVETCGTCSREMFEPFR